MKNIKRKCACGCDKTTNYGKKYIRWHNWRGRKHSEETKKKISDSKIFGPERKIKRRCACGCDKTTSPGMKYYISGHSMKGKRFAKRKIKRRCKCGCGSITNPGRKYIHGHTRKGLVFRRKIRRKCACGCGGITNYGRRYKIGHGSIGKTRTEDHKMKISLANKGRPRPDVSGKNCPLLRPDIRKKMLSNPGMLGKKHTLEARRKISKNHRDISGKNNPLYNKGYLMVGENNGMWRGGVSFEPYCHVWTDREYKSDIKERDNNECQSQHCKDKCNHLPLHLHHVDYIKKNCSPKNLITLCNSCNSRANYNRGYWKGLFRRTLSNLHGYKYGKGKIINGRRYFNSRLAH